MLPLHQGAIAHRVRTCSDRTHSSVDEVDRPYEPVTYPRRDSNPQHLVSKTSASASWTTRARTPQATRPDPHPRPGFGLRSDGIELVWGAAWRDWESNPEAAEWQWRDSNPRSSAYEADGDDRLPYTATIVRSDPMAIRTHDFTFGDLGHCLVSPVPSTP